METNLTSLRDEIYRANQYYVELSTHMENQKRQCQALVDDVMEIQEMIVKLYQALASATRMSNVGAPQAGEALKMGSAQLNGVYEHLYTNQRFIGISYNTRRTTAKMIHVTPDISARQSKLKDASERVSQCGLKMREYAEQIIDNRNLDSNDLTIYANKAAGIGENVETIGQFIGVLANYIAEGDRLYREAQINAIVRALSIPY